MLGGRRVMDSGQAGPSATSSIGTGQVPRGKWPDGDPGEVARAAPTSRYGLFALVALAAFIVISVDTAWRGPISSGVVGVNDVVAQWQARGLPVHPVGWALSQLGDFVVGIPILLLAAALCFWARAWIRALALLGIAGVAPGLVSVLQGWLTGKNRPIPNLDPMLIPDAENSPVRVGGAHLFPSGHSLEAVVDWGLLALLAVPVFLVYLKRSPVSSRRWRRFAIAGWLLAAVLTGIGRILRQAHGYNDVLAGWSLGLALLFAGLWMVDATSAWKRRRRIRKAELPDP